MSDAGKLRISISLIINFQKQYLSGILIKQINKALQPHLESIKFNGSLFIYIRFLII